jgi:nitrile hydratase subunit beta
VSYTSHADLGGRADDRPVRPEPAEPVFHAAWEARVLALTLAMGAAGRWNIDMSRAARETLPDYDHLSYYQIWLAALERLLLGQGLVQRDEIEAGHAIHAAQPLPRLLSAERVGAVLAAGAPTERPPERLTEQPGTQPPRFAVGQAVRTRAWRPDHHTRLPAYALGRRGRIERLHGRHVFADSHAQGLGERPQWLYGVVFDGHELFGAQAAAGDQVSIDAWESYLESVGDAA